MEYPCPQCTLTQQTLRDHRYHVRLYHHSVDRNLLYDCKRCQKKKGLKFESYHKHIRYCSTTNDHHQENYVTDNMPEDDFIVNDEADQQESPTEPLPEQPSISNFLSEVKDICDNFWISLSAEPQITKATVNLICGHQKTLIDKMLEIIKYPDLIYEKVQQEVDVLWKSSKSEYRRQQELYRSKYFVHPSKFALSDRHEPVSNFDQEGITLVTDYMARISIKKTLHLVLQSPSIFESLLMPKDFDSYQTYSHPFSGQRAKHLNESLRNNYIALQVYMDDYGTTNPLQTSTSSVYKMTGCYFRILNLPEALQSSYEHIFLSFLAYAKDFGTDVHLCLKSTIIQELLDLEQNGVALEIDGIEHHFPVVLFNLAGDNLGLHQMGGYNAYFAGRNACRICDYDYDEVTTVTTFDSTRLRTADNYDTAAFSDSIQVRQANGIKEASAFNELRYFHVQQWPTVDVMHDWFQGHLRYMIAFVLKSFPNYNQVYNTIKAFPFYGRDSFNIPRPIDVNQLGDQITGMTASTISTLIRFLPLILADLQSEENNTGWKLLLLFQKIYDVILSYSVTEEDLQNLESNIEEYLSLYIAEGGKMTVKPHYMLHYPQMIRNYGVLRHSWSMRYEGKHQPTKQYANVNRCFKSLPLTLANKHQIFAYQAFKKMYNENYVNDYLYDTYKALYKINDMVVFDLQSNVPVFGRIYRVADKGIFGIYKYRTLSFNTDRHCYVVCATSELLDVNAKNFVIHSSMRLYHQKYIRLPYALPAQRKIFFHV